MMRQTWGPERKIWMGFVYVGKSEDFRIKVYETGDEFKMSMPETRRLYKLLKRRFSR